MKPRLLAFPLAIILAAPVIAGQFIWTGATNSTWTTASNWDTTSVPTVSPDLFPALGGDYASDFLTIRNNGDLTALVPGTTPGAGAVYNPGAGVTTTFRTGRGFVMGIGNGPASTPPNVKGRADLTITSGTIAAVRVSNSGSEPFLANRADVNLLINGGNLDLSQHVNNFRLIQEGFTDANGPIKSTITIDSGSLSCRVLDLLFDTEADPSTVFGNGIINLNGGTFTLSRFIRSASADADQTSSTINLNGGTLKTFAAIASPNVFLPPLADTQVIVKAGGAIIDTNNFANNISADLLHDPALATPDGGLTKINTGTLTLSGFSTYNGGTKINQGNVIITSDENLGAASGGITFTGSSNLNIGASIEEANRPVMVENGVLARFQLAGGVTFSNSGKLSGTGTLEVRNTGTTGGTRNVILSNLENDFTGIIGFSYANNDQQTNLTVNSLADSAGAGNIVFNTINNIFPSFIWGSEADAPLALNHRQIQLAGTMGTTGAVVINNSNVTHPVTINTDLLVSGPAGDRRLTLSGVAGPVNEFAGDIADGVGSPVRVTKGNTASVWTLSGDNSHTGGTTLSGGTFGSQLNINSPTALGTGTFSIGGGDQGRIDNTSGAPITLSTNNAQAWNNNFTFVGTNSLNLGTGEVTLGGGRTVTVFGSTLNVGGNISGAFGLTKSGTGTIILNGSGSSYSGPTTVTAGSLILGADAPSGADGALGNASTEINLGVAGGNNDARIFTNGAFNVGRDIRIVSSDETDAGTRLLVVGGNTADNSEFSGNIILGSDNNAGRGVRLNVATGGQVTFSGVIQEPLGMDATSYTAVTKVNPGTALLTNANTYTGPTSVAAGTLALGATGSIANSASLNISAGASFDTSAKSTYIIPASQALAFGVNASGSGSSGRIVAADLNISAAVVSYNISGTPDDPVYVLATYNNLVGTPSFASVDPAPSGYTLDYAYQGNKIALVQAAGSPYDTWSGGAPFDGDANGDGVINGLAFLLGAANPNVSALDKLPATSQSGGNLVLTFSCLNAASRGSVVLTIEHSSNLGISDPWAAAVVPDTSGGPVAGVTFAITPGSPLNGVVATISSTEAAAGKLFGRLKAENP